MPLRPVRRRLGLAAAAAAALSLCARAAVADEREVCASDSERAQSLRAAGQLRAAEERLLACARPSCPAIVRRDCDEWLGEVRKSLPTIVFGVQDAAGHDLTDVRVTVDGAPLVARLDGKGVTVDPGAHTFHFEAGGGAAETKVLVREGEKDRLVTVRLERAPETRTTPTPTAFPRAPAPAAEPGRPGGRAPLGAFVFAGVGVVALGAFGVLALDGQTRFDRCESRGDCSSSDVQALERQRVVAWSLLGVGLVAAGVATWLLVRHP